MRNIGNLTIIALVILNIVVWLVFAPVYDGDPNFLRKYAGEVIGSNNTQYCCLARFCPGVRW